MITEYEMGHVHTLALDRHEVLSAVCKALEIYLTTEQFTLGRDHWIATPKDGPSFSGPLLTVAAYVRGYATAWHGQRRRRTLEREQIIRKIREISDG